MSFPAVAAAGPGARQSALPQIRTAPQSPAYTYNGHTQEGYAIDFVYYEGGDDFSAECDSDPLTWAVNQADYQYNGSVTSKVYIDGLEVGSTLDQVAAFVGDEIRGLADASTIPFGPLAGQGVFNIQLRSNVSSGETMTFKYYDGNNILEINLLFFIV